jgi:hypothetical protein
MSTPDKDLRLTVTVNGQAMLATGIVEAHIADRLAKHATMDDWMAAQGKSRDGMLWSIKEALETLEDEPTPNIVADIVASLLWAACRGEDGAKVEDAIRHGGVTLMCALKGDDSSGVSLLCDVSPDPTQH